MPIQHISMEDKKDEGVFTTMGKWMNQFNAKYLSNYKLTCQNYLNRKKVLY